MAVCRFGAFPHGVCWWDLCNDLEVVDVPGDHFSLLRQVGGVGRGWEGVREVGGSVRAGTPTR